MVMGEDWDTLFVTKIGVWVKIWLEELGPKLSPKKHIKWKDFLVESEATPESSSESLDPRSSQPVKTWRTFLELNLHTKSPYS
jgi:hypothetical protein